MGLTVTFLVSSPYQLPTKTLPTPTIVGDDRVLVGFSWGVDNSKKLEIQIGREEECHVVLAVSKMIGARFGREAVGDTESPGDLSPHHQAVDTGAHLGNALVGRLVVGI